MQTVWYKTKSETAQNSQPKNKMPVSRLGNTRHQGGYPLPSHFHPHPVSVLREKHNETILRERHNEMGHQGTDRTLSLNRERFFWLYMQADIENYACSLLKCWTVTKTLALQN